jgi:protein MpaA
MSALVDSPAAPARSPVSGDVIGRFGCAGQTWEIERFSFIGPPAGHEPVRLGLFASIHGDEPAGTEAVLAFLHLLREQPGRAAGYALNFYPVVNPVGFARGTRGNANGKDLNREFWRQSPEPEVGIIEAELKAQRFDGIITLHADDGCEGHYGYSHGRAMEDALLRPALLAADRVFPRDGRATIDGFAAREGVITDCYSGILSPPPGLDARAFNLIFETPATAPLARQVAAHLAALAAILATYRAFISYAQDL